MFLQLRSTLAQMKVVKGNVPSGTSLVNVSNTCFKFTHIHTQGQYYMMEQVKPQQSLSSVSPVLVMSGAEFCFKHPDEKETRQEICHVYVCAYLELNYSLITYSTLYSIIIVTWQVPTVTSVNKNSVKKQKQISNKHKLL